MARGGNPQAVFERALQALQAGDLEKAARDARKLTKQVPEASDAWSLRATVAQRAGAHAEAAKFFRRALQLKPGDPGLLNNLGNVSAETGEHARAVAYYEQSLAIRPGHPDTQMNLGNALMELRRGEDAAACFEAVLVCEPGHVGARLNLGGAYLLANRTDEALRVFQTMRDDGIDGADVRNNLYNALVSLGRLDEADAAMRRLLEAAPDDPKVEVGTSILHFLRARWQQGWRSYAARWRWKPAEARPFAQPWWDGEPLNGRKVLAWGEQGLGDEIMFAAMIPDLAARADAVVLECDPRLLGIFGRSFPTVKCVARTDPPAAETHAADIDFQVPTGNLGIWLRRDEAAFGAGAPYLRADKARAEALRAKYRAGAATPLVGITWRSSNPDVGARKSVALNDLTPVLRQPGLRFVDLQYGDTTAELTAFRAANDADIVHDPDIDPTRDVDGHAAQIAAMDLVISISNTTVHLAGALGVPTWCLIQRIPDRRWLLNRDDSPWYGSVRLFRQPTVGDWETPVARVATELSGLVST